MNGTSTVAVDPRLAERERPRLDGLNARMVSAEILKVRRRRGLMIWTALLTVGAVTLIFGITAILHAGNPARYGPAGGLSHLADAMGFLATLGSVAAVLIGTGIGTGDLQAGVFRDLVSTGRSRVALFAARVPGGLAVLWPLVAVAWLIACAASVAFAGGLPTAGIALMVQGGGWTLLATTSIYLLALGIASSTGSRSMTVGVLLAWLFVVSQLLLQISALGVLRQGLQMAALTRLIPAGLQTAPPAPAVATMSLGVAVVVLVTWAAIPLAAGAWRTRTQDA